MQILGRTGSILVVWSEQRERGGTCTYYINIMVYMCVWGWVGVCVGVGVGVYMCIEDISDPNGSRILLSIVPTVIRAKRI